MSSRVRLRNLARPGRAGEAAAGPAGITRTGAAPRRPPTDASSIAGRPPHRPDRTSLRPV